MYKAVIELESDVAWMTTKMSLVELREAPEAVRRQTMQRLFLGLVELLEHNQISASEIQAALMGVLAQHAVDDIAKLPHDVGARMTYEFFKAFGLLVGRMGLGDDNAGLSMLHAGAIISLASHGAKVTCETLAAIHREFSEGE